MDKIESSFTQFYAAYPRKRARIEALKAFRTVWADLPDIDDLLFIVEQNKLTDEWKREGGRYIPYPATWLRGYRWEDEISTGDTESARVEEVAKFMRERFG